MKQSSSLNMLTLGFILGGMTATMLTPRSGKNTRKTMTQRLDASNELLGTSVKKATETIENAKEPTMKESKMTDGLY